MSFTPKPLTELLDQVFDVRNWLAPNINDIHGHTDPHCFRFSLINGIAQMHYKNWSDDSWSKDGITILKVYYNKSICIMGMIGLLNQNVLSDGSVP